MRSEVLNIRLDLISPGLNSRKKFKEESLAQLAESFKPHGILQPIRVKENGDRFEIITGERRYRAAQIAGFDTIPCMVINKVTDSSANEQCLIENLAREDLVPMDKAIALSQYRENNSETTLRELAKRLGISESRMSLSIKLASLPEVVHSYFRDEDDEGFMLTQKHGEILFPLLSEDNGLENEILIELVKEAYEKHLTCEQLSKRVKQVLGGEKAEEQNDDEVAAIIDEAVPLFKERYGSKARIKYRHGTLSLSIPDITLDVLKSTINSFNAVQDDEDYAGCEDVVDVDSDDNNDYSAFCENGSEADCYNCGCGGYDNEGNFICIKNGNQAITGDLRTDLISAIKQGNTEVLSADLNYPLDIVAKRMYQGQVYTVITDGFEEDICVKYKDLFTDLLLPILQKEYCINIDKTKRVVVITLWGDSIKRGEVLTTPDSQATLCNPGEYSEFKVNDGVMIEAPFADIPTFVEALCLPFDK